VVRPRILIFACRNYSIARLPQVLQKAGAKVGVLCYSDAALAATRYWDWRYTLPPQARSAGTGLGWVRLAVVLAMLRPDIIIPGDERALYVMIGLEKRLGRLTEKLLLGAAASLRRSLPPRECVDAAIRRAANQRLAESLDIPCPVGTAPNSLAELEAFVSQIGLPVVIKSEGTVAGTGVWICRTIEEVGRAWSEHHRKTPGRRALVQKYLEGAPAMRSIAAVDGRVVAGLSMIKERCHPEATGPSAVVRIISHPGMDEAGDKMARALRLTGMASLDFIVCSDGSASLIEYNPRLTPVCHLGAPALRLVEALGAPSNEEPPCIADGTRIALYPQEWVRQGGEVSQERGLLFDIPSDDPSLFERLTRQLKEELAASGAS
jgi:hypothetical protein